MVRYGDREVVHVDREGGTWACVWWDQGIGRVRHGPVDDETRGYGG